MYGFPVIGALLSGTLLAVVLVEAGCPNNAPKLSIAGTPVCCPGAERMEGSSGYCIVGCGQSGIPKEGQSCTSVAVTASDYNQQVFGTAAADADAATTGDSQGIAGPLHTPAPLMAMAGVAIAGAAML